MTFHPRRSADDASSPLALARARRSRRVRTVRRRRQPDQHLLYTRPLTVLLAPASVDSPNALQRLVAALGSVRLRRPGGISRRAESAVSAAGAPAAPAPGGSGLQPLGCHAVSAGGA